MATRRALLRVLHRLEQVRNQTTRRSFSHISSNNQLQHLFFGKMVFSFSFSPQLKFPRSSFSRLKKGWMFLFSFEISLFVTREVECRSFVKTCVKTQNRDILPSLNKESQILNLLSLEQLVKILLFVLEVVVAFSITTLFI